MSDLTNEQIKKQSLNAFNQWKSDWIANTKANKPYIKGSIYQNLTGIGKGKLLLALANGPSLDRDIEIIKKYRKYFDIICVDKTFKYLMDHGIKPNYVCLCDANVNFEKYCNGLDTKDTILLSNMCSQKQWISYWKGPVFFFINKDSIKSEELFCAISDYYDLIPAASNVGNCMLVLCHLVLQYDKVICHGFDYSWQAGTYYAGDASPKECWMANTMISDYRGHQVRTSNNLMFSVKWIQAYLKNMRVTNFINCTEGGLLTGIPVKKLEKTILGEIKNYFIFDYHNFHYEKKASKLAA